MWCEREKKKSKPAMEKCRSENMSTHLPPLLKNSSSFQEKKQKSPKPVFGTRASSLCIKTMLP